MHESVALIGGRIALLDFARLYTRLNLCTREALIPVKAETTVPARLDRLYNTLNSFVHVHPCVCPKPWLYYRIMILDLIVCESKLVAAFAYLSSCVVLYYYLYVQWKDFYR